MRLIRCGPPGHERPFLLVDGNDSAIALSSIIDDFSPAFFASGMLDSLEDMAQERDLERVSIRSERIGPPITTPQKIICIGLNYRQHAAESNMEIPNEPIIFMKSPNTIVGPTDDVIIPRNSRKTDWEVELGVVIGKTAHYLESPDIALKYVAGYVLSNDISEREFQLERGGQWDKGKSCKSFNPLGPWLATSDEISDVQNLTLWLDVDGKREQTGSTADMIFSVSYLIWYISQFMVLEPGDLINTGTPAGVGHGKTPPKYLSPHQEIRLGITDLGEQYLRCSSSD